MFPFQYNILCLDLVSFDLRDKFPNCVTLHELLNEGGCNSSWAFAVASAMGDRLCINEYTNEQMSAEYIIQCSTKQQACRGGNLPDTLDFVMESGIVSQECKSYRASSSRRCVEKCDDGETINSSSLYHITNYNKLKNIRAMKAAIFKGTVVSQFTYRTSFLGTFFNNTANVGHTYTYNDDVGTEQFVTAIKIIGWNDGATDIRSNRSPAWICQLSRGQSFGNNGTFLLAQDYNSDEVINNAYDFSIPPNVDPCSEFTTCSQCKEHSEITLSEDKENVIRASRALMRGIRQRRKIKEMKNRSKINQIIDKLKIFNKNSYSETNDDEDEDTGSTNTVHYCRYCLSSGMCIETDSEGNPVRGNCHDIISSSSQCPLDDCEQYSFDPLRCLQHAGCLFCYGTNKCQKGFRGNYTVNKNVQSTSMTMSFAKQGIQSNNNNNNNNNNILNKRTYEMNYDLENDYLTQTNGSVNAGTCVNPITSTSQLLNYSYCLKFTNKNDCLSTNTGNNGNYCLWCRESELCLPNNKYVENGSVVLGRCSSGKYDLGSSNDTKEENGNERVEGRMKGAVEKNSKKLEKEKSKKEVEIEKGKRKENEEGSKEEGVSDCTYTTRRACLKDERCGWNTVTRGCVTRGSSYTPPSSFTVTDSFCLQLNCSRCLSESKCGWCYSTGSCIALDDTSGSGGTLESACSFLITPNISDQYSLSNYSSLPPYCSICSSYPTCRQCALDSRCAWMAEMRLCLPVNNDSVAFSSMIPANYINDTALLLPFDCDRVESGVEGGGKPWRRVMVGMVVGLIYLVVEMI